MKGSNSAKKILIVDDEKTVRQFVSLILKTAGYRVIEASDGRDALKVLDGHDIGIIITDLCMPHMNGIELTRQLRESHSHGVLPVVMMTSGFHGYRKREGEDAGVSEWVAKPFMHQQLLSVVKRFVN